MQFIAGEQISIQSGRPLVKQVTSFVPLPKYCGIAIETLTYLTDLRTVEGLCRGVHFHQARGCTIPGYLSVAISVWILVVTSVVGSIASDEVARKA
jgi:hypothetical protein